MASQQIDIGISVLVDAGLVREETDALSANQLYAIAQQHRYPRHHPAFCQLVCRVGLLVDHYAAAAQCKERREQPIVSHHRGLSGNFGCLAVPYDSRWRSGTLTDRATGRPTQTSCLATPP